MSKCFICDGPAFRQMGGVLVCPEHAAAIDDEIEHEMREGRRVDVQKIARSMREPEESTTYKPSAEDVREFLKSHDITGSQAAKMMYLSGANQVRKYTGGHAPRQMDGARWFCLHAHKMLSQEQLNAIERSMLDNVTR